MSLESSLDATYAFQMPEVGRWLRAGVEPTTTELLADPIALLLMRADRLKPHEVATLIRVARKRRALQ
jgi:hypothetical protein